MYDASLIDNVLMFICKHVVQVRVTKNNSMYGLEMREKLIFIIRGGFKKIPNTSQPASLMFV